MLKVLGIVFILTLGLFFAIPFFLDDNVSIEREILINSNSEIIFEAINEIRVWEEWFPRVAEDTSLTFTYSGRRTGVGAEQFFYMNEDLTGSNQITKSEPTSLIEFKIKWAESEEFALGTFNINQIDSANSKVIWRIDRHLGDGTIARYAGIFMEGFFGQFMVNGLSSLKAYSEPKFKALNEKIELGESTADTLNTEN